MTHTFFYLTSIITHKTFASTKDLVSNINLLISYVNNCILNLNQKILLLWDEHFLTIVGIVLSILIIGQVVIYLMAGSKIGKDFLQIAANVATVGVSGLIVYNRITGGNPNDDDKNKKRR